ncbi:MAG: VacB/RNase II family 3'-5' exoribonuclease, partial [Alphaproteobacteria bacterium]
ALGAPTDKRWMGQADRWIITSSPPALPAPAKGERWLVNVVERHKHTVLLTATKLLPRPDQRTLIGLVGEYHRVRVLNRELAAIDFVLNNPKDAAVGDYIRLQPHMRPRTGPTPVKMLANLGSNPKGLESLAAIENHNLPVEFPADVLAEAEGLPAYKFNPAEGRTDWRDMPIVTIDGPDARDFDDAVWAEPLEGGGHRVRVAIADVAFYVKPGTALDEDAQERGNSTYFPDRVIPMLPERLSNDLCSLRPLVDRPVFGVEMEVDSHGHLQKYAFCRAVIHSAARLTYQQVQAALDGTPDATTLPLLPNLKHLLAAYNTLDHARLRRGALDLELPELGIELDKEGNVLKVANRARLTSHKLIEELMILANVAAASALSRHKVTGFYRIHDKPDKMKLMTLTAALKPLGFTMPAIDGGHKAWANLVEQVKSHPARNTLLRQILQSQMQAKYSTDNIGHYGLSLPLYSHFTSPIRRYSDLVTHRALLHILGTKQDLPSASELGHVAQSINMSERKSQQAEWEARDRIIARHYAQFVGKEFTATVTNALNFGMFASIDEGVEGLLPARMMGWDWHFSPAHSTWRNNRSKKTLQSGSTVRVVLVEADRASGRLTFKPL